MGPAVPCMNRLHKAQVSFLKGDRGGFVLTNSFKVASGARSTRGRSAGLLTPKEDLCWRGAEQKQDRAPQDTQRMRGEVFTNALILVFSLGFT